MGSVVMPPPAAVTGLALNCKVVPMSMLLFPGVKTIFAGVGTAEVPVALPPPQPVRLPNAKVMDKTANTQGTNRRMHPPRLSRLPRLSDESLYLLENPQCRGQR
jgi:hypothetical protein